jgi:rhamnogalacturonyl hydrolase YesR
MNTRIICLSLQQNHINRREKMTNKVFFLILAVAGLGWSNTVTSQTTAGEPCTFTEGVRYSQLVINSRINDFKANQFDAGFGVFDSQGNLIAEPNYSMKNLDYVPGLVAKAIIEAVYYYKDNSMVDVRPWYYAIQYYANTYDITQDGKEGKCFDDINAVKLYFKLQEMAGNKTFAESPYFTNDETVSTAKKRFADALTSIAIANTDYVIKESTLAGAAGGWWHKSFYTDQMWCDGQYMGPALLAQMANEYTDYAAISDNDWDLITKQFTISWHYLWNDEVKLLYHAFTADPAGEAAKIWVGISAEPGAEVYHSAEYWGRATGWYFLALVDVLEQMVKAGLTATENFQTLYGYLQQLAAGIAAKQDVKTGCWYQLLNYDDTYVATDYNSDFCYTSSPVANYLESSCTAIFIASYLKGMRLGLFDADYTDLAKKAYRGFVENFMVADGMGGVHLVRCSKSAGLAGFAFRDGSANYYLMGKDTEPTSTSGSNFYTEGKVLGGFIMAATEYERLGDTETGIVPVRKQNATTSSYSLSGTKLSQPSRRGIYVKGGKKYLPTKE